MAGITRTQKALLCVCCGKAAPVQKGRAMPEGWRRVNLSNPVDLKKRGVGGIVCSLNCARDFIDRHW